MIHHISIAAQNPLRVASVLAEICHGKLFDFPNPVGSYAVVVFDDYGTGIEVFPLGSVCVPGSDTEPSKVIQMSSSPSFAATHAAISVPASQQQIEQIGMREGWQVALGDRGVFKVVEFWLENRLLIEFLPPELASQYLQSIRPQIVEQVLGQPIQMTQI